MKLKLIAMIVGLAGVTGMTACSKCKICTRENSSEIRHCEKDFSNKTEYGFAVDATEALGYTCKESL